MKFAGKVLDKDKDMWRRVVSSLRELHEWCKRSDNYTHCNHCPFLVTMEYVVSGEANECLFPIDMGCASTPNNWGRDAWGGFSGVCDRLDEFIGKEANND